MVKLTRGAESMGDGSRRYVDGTWPLQTRNVSDLTQKRLERLEPPTQTGNVAAQSAGKISLPANTDRGSLALPANTPPQAVTELEGTTAITMWRTSSSKAWIEAMALVNTSARLNLVETFTTRITLRSIHWRMK